MRNAFLSLLIIAVSSAGALRAEDLVTRDGTVYHDYKVLGHDAGYLTIMYSDGGGKIPLSNLPDDLQKKYGYNKEQADAFVKAATAQDRQDRQAIADEEARHQQQLAARTQPAASAETPAPSPSAAPAVANAPAPPAAAPASSTPDPAPSVSQDDIDSLKQKITDLQEDIVSLQMGLRGAAPTDNGAYHSKLSDDQTYLETLQGQLRGMEMAHHPKILTWDDVGAAHEEIVGFLDDIDTIQHDSKGADYAGGLRVNYKCNDDQLDISVLRLLLEKAKVPANLSPEEVDALQKKEAELNDDVTRTNREATLNSGRGSLGVGGHEFHEESEQLMAVREELATALHSKY